MITETVIMSAINLLVSMIGVFPALTIDTSRLIALIITVSVIMFTSFLHFLFLLM